MRSRSWNSRELLGANSEDFLSFNFHLDAEGRAQVGSLHDTPANPNASGKISQFEGVKNGAAARISDHGMPGGAVAVIGFQFFQVSKEFELAIAVGSFLLEGPVATRLGRGASRQTNKQAGDVFAGKPVADIKLFRGPRLGHLGRDGDSGIRVGRVRKQRARIGRRRGNFNLRLLLGEPRLDVFGAKSPARSKENDEKDSEKSDDQFDGGIRRCGRAGAGTGNAGNLRHFGLEAIRWGLVGHCASLRFYTQRGESRKSRPGRHLRKRATVESEERGDS